MPLTLICRRCGSDVFQIDSFCQECGLAQSRNRLDTELSHSESAFDWPALEADPVPSYDNPCITSLSGQNYEFGSYQLNLDPMDKAPEEETKLHSPIFDSAQHNYQAYDNNLGMRGGWAMVLIDAASVLAIVAFVSALSYWGYKNHTAAANVQKKNSTQSALQTVKSAAAKGEFEQVFKTLSPLPSDELSENQRILLDEAAYRLGQNELAKGQVKKSMSFFNQVSIESDHYVSARQMIFSYASPVVPAQSNEGQEKAQRKSRRWQQPSLAGTDSSSTAAAENPKSARALITKEDKKAGLSDEPVLSIPLIPEIEKANKSQDNSPPEAESGKQVEPGVRKFSESEISHYNRLLAEYFRIHGGKKHAEESTSEAPSFKEWLKQGKPNF